MGRKIGTVENSKGEFGGYVFWCPGCKNAHIFNQPGGVSWQFNNDMENPTFSPSYLTGHKNFSENRCHSFVKNGQIQFLNDCFHELKGQTVTLPDWDSLFENNN